MEVYLGAERSLGLNPIIQVCKRKSGGLQNKEETQCLKCMARLGGSRRAHPKRHEIQVYNGNDNFFWKDPWLEYFPLINHTLREINLEDSFKMVKAYWRQDEGWNWEALNRTLPSIILLVRLLYCYIYFVIF